MRFLAGAAILAALGVAAYAVALAVALRSDLDHAERRLAAVENREAPTLTFTAEQDTPLCCEQGAARDVEPGESATDVGVCREGEIAMGGGARISGPRSADLERVPQSGMGSRGPERHHGA